MAYPMSADSTVAAFAHACDFGSIEDYARLLDEDVSMTTVVGSGDCPRTTHIVGREEIVASTRRRRNQGELGPGSGKMHLLGPSSVEYTSAHTVQATTHWLLVGLEGQQSSVLMAGYYRDDLVRTRSQWRIVGRNTTILSTELSETNAAT